MKTLLLLLIVISCGKDPVKPSNSSSASKVAAPLSVKSCVDTRLSCSSVCTGSSPVWENCQRNCFARQDDCILEKCEDYCGEKMLPFNKYEDCRNECYSTNKIDRY